MRSSGGKRLNNPKKVLCCNVTFLDDAVATYEVPKDAKGSVLYQSVVRYVYIVTVLLQYSYYTVTFLYPLLLVCTINCCINLASYVYLSEY